MNAESYRLVKRSVNGLTSEAPVNGMFIKAASLGPGHDDIEVDAVNSKLLSKLDNNAFTIKFIGAKAGQLVPADDGYDDDGDVVEFLPSTPDVLKDVPVNETYLAIAYAEVADSGEASRMADRIADHRAAKISTAAMADMLKTMLQHLVDFNQKYGLVHNDLHQGNVLYDKTAGKFVVIDYGRSVFRKIAALKEDAVKMSNEVKAITGITGNVDVSSNEYCDPWHWDNKKKHEAYYWVSDYATICMQIFFGCYLKCTGTPPSTEARQKFQPLDHIDAVRKYLGRALTKIVEPAAHLYNAIVCTGMGTINPCFNANFTMTKTGTTVFMDHLNNYIKKTGFSAAIFHRNARDVALNYHVIADFVEGIKKSGLKTPFGAVASAGGGALDDDRVIDCPFPTTLHEAYRKEFRALTEPLVMERFTEEQQFAAESIGEVIFEEPVIFEGQLPPAMPMDKTEIALPFTDTNGLGWTQSPIEAYYGEEDDSQFESDASAVKVADAVYNKHALPTMETPVYASAMLGGASASTFVVNIALAAVVGACSILGSMR